MLSKAVTELEEKLLKLQIISYKSIDSLMRKIMKSYNITAKQLHNAFKQKHKKTPDDWIQEKMKKLQEDHKELQSGKTVDDEGYMARNQLNQIETSVKKLKKIIDSPQSQLPSWVQSKITLAADYINSVSNYMESDENVKENISFDVSKARGLKGRSDSQIEVLTKANPNNIQLKKENERRRGQPQLPSIKIESMQNPLTISLVEKILGEEKCGKGMYWCNTDQVCKPIPNGMKVSGQKVEPTEVGIGKPVAECSHTHSGEDCPVHGKKECPMSEEKDPKGPTKSYKSPEEIAKKHGVSLDEIKKQLEMGTKVEFEHTTSKTEARITALQHLDELPDYYTNLKKMETQKESSIVRDANGNPYVEFIDLISAGSIKEENPGLWKNIHKRRERGLPRKKPGQKGYPETLDIDEGIQQARKNVGASKCWKDKKLGNPPTKIKDGEEVPNCVDEAVRMPAQTGNNIFVTLSWRGKYYSIQLFFPQAKIPSRLDITDEIQKIYPNSRVVTYRVSDLKPGEPLIYAHKGGSGGKLGPNKNYVKPMGVEVEMTEAGDWWHPDPDKDRTLSGRGPAVRTREDGVRPKLSKFSVKSSDPKKLRPGESYMEYAKRMKSMREGVEILDEKK